MSSVTLKDTTADRHPFADLQTDLDRLAAVGRSRSLQTMSGLDFSSNDYLAFANSDELRAAALEALSNKTAVGSGGSRLLRGNHAQHVALEGAAAAFFGAESTLYFSSGFAANLTLFATAPQRGDLVVHDEWVHASVHDGLRRSRAQAASSRHNCAQSIDDAILAWRASGARGRVWIAVESLYSMDGDGPDLEELAALADRREAVLVVDEAHATGVMGPQGRGRAAFLEGRENVVTVHTCGKALGSEGALICAPRVLIDFLVNRGRPFIFSTAPSPLMAAVTQARNRSLRAQRSAPGNDCAGSSTVRRVRCRSTVGLTASGSHIVPIVVGKDQTAVELAARLRAHGYDVRAIRPPTVPPGTARLRIALTLNVDEAAVEGLLTRLGIEMTALSLL